MKLNVNQKNVKILNNVNNHKISKNNIVNVKQNLQLNTGKKQRKKRVNSKLNTSSTPNFEINEYNHENNSKIDLSNLKTNSIKRYFEKIENQQQYIENLYKILELTSIEDWKQITRSKIIENKGKSLLKYYSFNLQTLFTTIYPNYPWKMEQKSTKENPLQYFKSFENQKDFLDKIFTKFQFKTMDNWLNFSATKLKLNGGYSLLHSFYSNNFSLLLSTIYPNFPWQFDQLHLKSKINYFKSIENQRKFMDELYAKFQLKSLDDWLLISRRKIVIHKGKRLIIDQYNNNYFSLLSTIYPNFPFNFDHSKLQSRKEFFKSIENQRKFMDELYAKFQLNSLDDWLLISPTDLILNKGKIIICYYYSNDMKKLLLKIYPNFTWEFHQSKEMKIRERHRKRLLKIGKKLEIKSLADWLFISKSRFIINGGSKLLSYYLNDLNYLLKILFPYFDWTNREKIILDRQRLLMENIFKKLKLNELEEWLNVSRFQFIKKGGKKILNYYSNNFSLLLSSIYPHFDWKFNQRSIRFKPNILHTNDLNFIRSKLKKIQEKYWIKEKKDWYRLPLRLSFLHLPSSLLLSFPPSSTSFNHINNNLNNKGEKKRRGEEEGWNEEKFCITKKKSKQRLLFAYLQRDIYKHQQIIEEYHLPSPPFPSYPHNNKNNNNNNKNNNLNNKNKDVDSNDYDDDDKGSYYYDIFIPSLNLAIEYQGEQHYDEIPSISSIQVAQSRDIGKLSRSSKLSVHIIFIPYWWDLSLASLLSSILSSSPSHLRF